MATPKAGGGKWATALLLNFMPPHLLPSRNFLAIKLYSVQILYYCNINNDKSVINLFSFKNELKYVLVCINTQRSVNFLYEIFTWVTNKRIRMPGVWIWLAPVSIRQCSIDICVVYLFCTYLLVVLESLK